MEAQGRTDAADRSQGPRTTHRPWEVRMALATKARASDRPAHVAEHFLAGIGWR
jgi:hypothetical protein